MTVEFKGQSPDVVRVSTGLYTLDRIALGFQGQYGMPLRSLYEIYGRPGSGKSSLAYYLAGRVRTPGRVLVADLEANLDKKYVVEAIKRSGFSGTIQAVDYKDAKGKPRSHERMIQDLADAILEQEDVTSGILDSLGMMSPVPEQAKDLGESTMGVRAKVTADFARRTANKLLMCPEPKAMFVVNHVHDPIGGRGHITPGGETLKYMSNVRLWLYRLETLKDGSFCAEAKVEKLKYGGVSPKRKGLIFIIPGFGVSPEMTAVFDCFQLGLAERGNTVKMDLLDNKTGKFKSRSMGYLEKNLVEWAKEGKAFQFEPFFEALAKAEEGDAINAEEVLGSHHCALCGELHTPTKGGIMSPFKAKLIASRYLAMRADVRSVEVTNDEVVVAIIGDHYDDAQMDRLLATEVTILKDLGHYVSIRYQPTPAWEAFRKAAAQQEAELRARGCGHVVPEGEVG